MKICLQRADNLGDCIPGMSLIPWVRKAFRDAEIQIMVAEKLAPLFTGWAEVDTVIPIPQRANFEDIDVAACKDALKKHRPDVFVSLWEKHGFVRAAKEAGIPKIVADIQGDPHNWRYATVPVKRPWHDITRHQVEWNLDLLRPIGVDIPLERIELSCPVNAEAERYAASFLDKHKLQYSRFAVISFGSTGRNKLPEAWPPACVAAFIDWLYKERDMQAVLCGALDQQPYYAAIRSQCQCPPIDAVGNGYVAMAGLMKYAACYVGGDTGLVQMAAAFKKPCLVLYPTKLANPMRWGPWGTRQRIICRPYRCDRVCNTVTCPDWQCSKDISLSEAVRGFEDLMSENMVPKVSQLKRYWASKVLRPLLLGSVEEHLTQALARSEMFYGKTEWPRGLGLEFWALRQQMIRDNLWVLHVPQPLHTFKARGLQILASKGLPLKPLLVLGHADVEDLLDLYIQGFSQPERVLHAQAN